MKWLALVGALTLTGCVGSSTAVRSVVATAANGLLPVMTQKYDAEQRQCVEDHPPPDKEGAVKCVADVRSHWKPVWDAWDLLRMGVDGDAIGAWCKFLDAVKVAKIELPVLTVGVTCE